MRTALVTTTINVPHVLRLYRRCDPDVRFFIATDKKTPNLDAFVAEIGNASWFLGGATENWKITQHLPFNCIQRRNIATLEALKWGADLIVFVDDDNIPFGMDYFEYYQAALGFKRAFKSVDGQPQHLTEVRSSHLFDGLLASPEVDWFDVGAFLDPPSSHRGFPHEHARRRPRLSHVVDAKVGAVAGIVLGDPDVSAVTRIAKSPHVLNVSPLLNAGIAVNPRHTRTVFNTQNSAVLRELAPAMLLCPQFKRYDDIIASLVCQRVMADTGHHVLFGPPFVYQERNAHSLSRDLADEQWGQENILKVQAAIWSVEYHPARDLIVDIYEKLDTLMPGVAALAEAWLEDCERAMS